jgi:hypothetical protein
MRLVDLDAKFLKRSADDCWTCEGVSLADADGLMLLCPVCFRTNGGKVGTHAVICWQPHVPQTALPGPGRWNFQGTGIEDLTLVAGSSSVLLQGAPCQAHFYVRGGAIVDC